MFLALRLHGGQYFQDFTAVAEGATNFGDGSSFFSTIAGAGGGVTDATYKELQFAQPFSFNTRSAFILPALEPSAPVAAFSVKFNAVIYGTYPNAGDGFSFSFGQFSADTNLIGTSFSQEAGYTNGLCFSVQTRTAPGFYVRVDGQTVASSTFDPSVQWGTNNPARHFFEIDWAGNTMTVRMDHQTLFANVAVTSFIPHIGDRFVFAARTSNNSQYFRIDNVLAVTGGILNKFSVGSPYYQDANATAGAANAFNNNFASPYTTAANSGYVGGTLVSSKNVKAYAISTSEFGGTSTQPQTWRLEGGSGDGVWNSGNSLVTGRFINAAETRAWLATNATAYPAWRLNVITNNGSVGSTFVEEVELFEMTPVPTPPYANAVNDQGNFGFFVGDYHVQPQSFAFTVYPGGAATAVTFEWGLTTAYGNTFSTNVLATNGAVTLSAPLGFPEGGKDYHYRITVQNANGTVQTVDQVFHLPAECMIRGYDIYGLGVLNNAIIAADFNDDGKLDVINSGYIFRSVDVATRSCKTQILINDVDGSTAGTDHYEPFLQADNLSMSQNSLASVGAVVVNDFNNDGRLDVYLNGWYAELVIAPFHPDAPFRQFLYPGYEPKRDPVGSSFFSTSVANRLIAPTVPNNITAGQNSRASTADFNGDGRVDLLMANTWPQGSALNNSPYYAPLPPTLYLNRAHGYWTGNPLGGPQSPGLDQIDFVPVVCGLPFSAQFLLGDGGLHLPFGSRPVEADYDNDGDIDVYNCTAGLYRNNCYGQFTLVTNLPSGGQNAAWGDFNHDGTLDVVLTIDFESRLYRNEGGGNFTDTGLRFPAMRTDALSGNFPPVLAWADVDHNGWLDLYVRGYTSSNYVNAVYFNSNGVFTLHSIMKPDADLGGQYYTATNQLGTSISKTAVTFADFNGDGRLDIAECSEASIGYLSPDQSSLWFVYNLLGSSNQPPGAPIGLNSSSGPGSVTLNWGHATDEMTPSAALTYNLRVGTTPGGGDIVSSLAKTNGFRLVSTEGNCWLAHTRTLRLPPGTYYWSVQAIDGGFLGGPFAAEQTFTITNRGTPYIYEPEVSNVASNSATVSAGIWTSYQNALCWIEYGLTPAYGQTNSLLLITNENIPFTTAPNVGTNSTMVPFQAISQHTPSFNLSSLLSGRDYHYHFAVSNSVGVVYGPDAVFTTLGEPPPRLLIALTNGAIHLAWTNSATNFTAQHTTNLNPPSWSAVPGTPINTNGMFQLTVPANSSVRYFRLQKP